MKSNITEITDLFEALQLAKPHLQIASCFSSATAKEQEPFCTSPEYLLQKGIASAFEKNPQSFEGFLEARRTETPLLLDKSQRNWRCTAPSFTEKERLERTTAVELLNEYGAYVKYSMQEGDEEVPNQMTSDDMESDNVSDVTALLISDLYFLARCGDESAFLELLNLESTFINHPFFGSSLEAWQREARAGNKASEKILKGLASCLAQSIDPTGSKLGRPREEGSEKILKDFEALYDPDKEKSFVYGKIAKDLIKNEGKEIRDRGEVDKRRKAVKMMVERDSRVQIELSILESKPVPWLFKYLRREYETPESGR